MAFALFTVDFVPVSCWMFRSPWHMYEAVNLLSFQGLILSSEHMWNNVITTASMQLKILTNSWHPSLPDKPPSLFPSQWVSLPPKAELCKIHCWGQYSTVSVLSRKQFEVRAGAQTSEFGEVVSAQQSFQLRSGPNSALTPNAELWIGCKGSKLEETLGSER